MKKLLILSINLVLISSCGLINKTGTFIDPRDNVEYKTIKIEDQTWFAENLKFKSDSDCWCYNDDEKNCNTYGRLYNLEIAKKVCPEGWRLPTIKDWQIMLSNIGMDVIYLDTLGLYSNRRFDSINIGGKLKSKLYWTEKDRNNNETGFNALPSGGRFSNGEYSRIGYETSFWTDVQAVFHLEGYNSSYIWASPRYNDPVSHSEEGNPVRCIKNSEDESSILKTINPKGKAIAIIDRDGNSTVSGEVQLNYNYNTNSMEPMILKPGNLILFRSNVEMLNNFSANAGTVYRVDSENKLFEIGRFDCNDADEKLIEEFLLKSNK
jgi:uncharacterized protein (TIGR02145 family)